MAGFDLSTGKHLSIIHMILATVFRTLGILNGRLSRILGCIRITDYAYICQMSVKSKHIKQQTKQWKLTYAMD